MHFETPISGSLNEHEAIARALLDGPDGESSPDGATSEVEAAPATDYACLGCGAVTTAREEPRSCPVCHRTPGDRRAAALFQPLD